MVSCRGTFRLSSTCFILLRVFRFFLFLSFFLFFLWILLLFGFKESLSVLKIKDWSCSQVPKWSFEDELLQPYLVINITGLVEFGKNSNYILPPLVSHNYLQQSISLKLIDQFLYLINGYLFFRCLEKVFEEETNQNEKQNRRSVTTTQLPSEVAVQSCSVKKVFLKVLQNSQENTCARAFFLLKLKASGLQLY